MANIGNRGMTRVACRACDTEHRLTPSAMAIILEALQDGDLHRVSGNPPTFTTMCILKPLSTVEAIVVVRRYRGSIGWEV